MKKLELGVLGITILFDENKQTPAQITSNVEVSPLTAFNASWKAIESMVLSHFNAGIDVTLPSYLEGIESSFKAIARYEQDTEILSTQIKDWRISEDPLDEIPNEYFCNYTLKVSKASNALYFSVYNAEYDKHPQDLTPFGLHGVVEIRNGLPAMSLSVSEYENDLHVITNTSTAIAVVKDVNSTYHQWQPVEFYQNHYGLVFETDGKSHLAEARAVIAADIFANYDFKDLKVETSNGWESDVDCLSKKVFIAGSDELPSSLINFVVRFQKDTAYAVKAGIEE
jgi:hypothetical protein